jgi:hypothetical protein
MANAVMAYQEFLGTAWPLIAISAAVVYVLTGGIYRLYLSPISKFPGPKLAALTLWYEFYYDVVRNGRYMWEIEKMHEKDGRFKIRLTLPDVGS